MTLSTFNITELGVFSASILGAIALLIKQIQNSRCKNCSVCWGFCNCDREVPVQVPPIAVEGFSEANDANSLEN